MTQIKMIQKKVDDLQEIIANIMSIRLNATVETNQKYVRLCKECDKLKDLWRVLDAICFDPLQIYKEKVIEFIDKKISNKHDNIGFANSIERCTRKKTILSLVKEYIEKFPILDKEDKRNIIEGVKYICNTKI